MATDVSKFNFGQFLIGAAVLAGTVFVVAWAWGKGSTAGKK